MTDGRLAQLEADLGALVADEADERLVMQAMLAGQV